MNMNDHRFLLGLSYHEASHAICALALGIPVERIAISLRGGGVVRYGESRATPLRRVAAALAPDCAIEHFPACRPCSPDDKAKASAYLSGITVAEAGRFTEEARRRARSIVAENVEVINAAA